MTETSTSPVLVEVTRGPAVESRHRGQIVVVDAQGKLVHQVGDPEVLVCLRSLAKPFQALAVVTSGAANAFGFKGAELALFSGSLSGQEFQTFLLTSILERLGLKAEVLQCGVHPPLHKPTAQALAKAGQAAQPLAAHLRRQTHRHAGPLRPPEMAHRRLSQSGPPGATAHPGPRGPDDRDAPAANQGGHRRLRRPGVLRAFEEYRPGLRPPGRRPTGFPGGHAAGGHPGPHPRHIAGDGRLETMAMQALPGKIFAKSGSEGGYALSLIDGGLGVALKIEDGGTRALNPSVVALMEQLGVMTPVAAEALARFREPAILNHRQEEVGRIRPVFALGT